MYQKTDSTGTRRKILHVPAVQIPRAARNSADNNNNIMIILYYYYPGNIYLGYVSGELREKISGEIVEAD